MNGFFNYMRANQEGIFFKYKSKGSLYEKVNNKFRGYFSKVVKIMGGTKLTFNFNHGIEGTFEIGDKRFKYYFSPFGMGNTELFPIRIGELDDHGDVVNQIDFDSFSSKVADHATFIMSDLNIDRKYYRPDVVKRDKKTIWEKVKVKAQSIVDNGADAEFYASSGSFANKVASKVADMLGSRLYDIQGARCGRSMVYWKASNELLDYYYDFSSKRMSVNFKSNQILPMSIPVHKLNSLIPVETQKYFADLEEHHSKDNKDIHVPIRLFDYMYGFEWFLFSHLENDTFMCYANLNNPICAEWGTVTLREMIDMCGDRLTRDTEFKETSLDKVISSIEERIKKAS